jgi:hypothetical protein
MFSITGLLNTPAWWHGGGKRFEPQAQVAHDAISSSNSARLISLI